MPATTKDPVGYGLSKELRTERKKLADKANSIAKKANEEKREWSESERAEFDKLYSAVEELDTRITKLEKLESGEDEGSESGSDGGSENTQPDDEGNRSNPRGVANRNNPRPGDNPARGGAMQNRARVAPRQAYETPEQFRNRERRATKEYFDATLNYLLYGNAAIMNNRAVQADVDVLGGYLILPEIIGNKLLKAVDNILFLQKKATVTKVTNAQSLGNPSLDNNPDAPDWTTEIATITQDSSMSFGKRSLTPTPLRKRLLVSERFLRMAFQAYFDSNDDANGQGGSPEDIIINRLAYMFANTKEKFFFLGNGVGQPLGIFTPSARGISTSRDIQTGSATNLTYNGLINAKFALKAQYHNDAEWIASRAFVSKAMQLVDSNGRPLLDFQTLPNTPTTLLQCPVNMSEWTPNVFTSGSYVGAIGVMRFYHIVDSQDVTVKQADQLYMETGQVGFFMSAESDGMPALEEAFVRLITN